MSALLSAILTPEELAQIKLRPQIVRFLMQKFSQRKIVKMLKTSITTVSRGARELKNGNGIFKKILPRVFEREIENFEKENLKNSAPQNEKLFEI